MCYFNDKLMIHNQTKQGITEEHLCDALYNFPVNRSEMYRQGVTRRVVKGLYLLLVYYEFA